jgi:enoyl-CoA hydratase/carnithine racemase
MRLSRKPARRCKFGEAMENHVEISQDGAVQIARFNRPEKKNALTAAMYRVLMDAIETANASEDVAATLFLGQPGIFTGGNDITDFLAAREDWTRDVLRFLDLIADSQKPLLAAVDGPAAGIGTTLLFHCDLVYASPRALFLAPFVNLGVVPEAASSLLAPRLMGHHRAFELLVLGETFSAERAMAAGFVNAIVPEEELEARALAAAQALAAKPRGAMLLSRKLLRADAGEVKARIREEVRLFSERMASPEARQAFKAFLEKSQITPAAL